jgi:pSer/pThr/pTyr-binding forkhead associated (FHA) protein
MTQQAQSPQQPAPSKLFIIYALRSDGSEVEIVKVPEDGSEVVLGRRELEQYAWRDPQTISRKHFTIRVKDGKAYVRDDGSLNGTYIDGKDIRGKSEVEVPLGKEIALVNPEQPVLKLLIKEA